MTTVTEEARLPTFLTSDDGYTTPIEDPIEHKPPRPLSPHFFRRENDGSVRLRLRFTPEEAALIEEAAGETPLLLYIHRVLNERARFHIQKADSDQRREV